MTIFFICSCTVTIVTEDHITAGSLPKLEQVVVRVSEEPVELTERTNRTRSFKTTTELCQ